jgi:uncharacterized lipoprotein YmbA
MKRMPIRHIAGWGLFMWALFLIGCSSTPPVAFYTLSPLQSAQQDLSPTGGNSGLIVGLGPVRLPAFLDRPHIVTRPGPNRLEVSEFHRWGGSLKESLPRVLAENISSQLGTEQVAAYPWKGRLKPDVRVAVDIHQFDGRLGEAVDLVAAWRIFLPPDNSVRIFRRSTIRTPVKGAGYEPFVAAQSRAVGALAQAIAKEIDDLTRGKEADN